MKAIVRGATAPSGLANLAAAAFAWEAATSSCQQGRLGGHTTTAKTDPTGTHDSAWRSWTLGQNPMPIIGLRNGRRVITARQSNPQTDLSPD
jgi:hypothetical protein